MNEKKILKIARIVIIVGVIFLAIILCIAWYLREYRYSVAYVQNHEHWIQKNDKGLPRVDVTIATNERAIYDDRGIISYNDGRVHTAFQSWGMYKGDFFSTLALEGNRIVLEIGPTMDAHNGIREIFVMEKFENGKPWLYVFVDAEWIASMPRTNLVWGKDFQHEQLARFQLLKNGVYYTKVQDDMERFVEVEGSDVWQQMDGLLVGDVSREDWLSNTLSDKTVVHFG